MTTGKFRLDAESLAVEQDQARELGLGYAQTYQSAEPYNHICIDDFLPPSVLEKVRGELGAMPDPEASFSDSRQNLKTSFNPDRLPSYTRTLFHTLNSRPFLTFLEEMTGIQGLIPDPYFMGAGIHKVANGGHLDIHADFNVHKVMKLERRLNVLIYLNPEWKEEWGGSFEIWDNKMSQKEASFVPTFNRMVCFSTGSNTFHGNPEKVNHPEGQPRLSIALYYYTATWDDTRISHPTLFKPRPGSKDEVNKKTDRRLFIQNVTPPFLFRRLSGPLKRLGLIA